MSHCPLSIWAAAQIETRSRGGCSRLAHQLAKNTVAHEMKLLADGKSRADVYAKLLPGYLAAKTGLSPAQCAEYCQARLKPMPERRKA